MYFNNVQEIINEYYSKKGEMPYINPKNRLKYGSYNVIDKKGNYISTKPKQKKEDKLSRLSGSIKEKNNYAKEKYGTGFKYNKSIPNELNNETKEYKEKYLLNTNKNKGKDSYKIRANNNSNEIAKKYEKEIISKTREMLTNGGSFPNIRDNDLPPKNKNFDNFVKDVVLGDVRNDSIEKKISKDVIMSRLDDSLIRKYNKAHKNNHKKHFYQDHRQDGVSNEKVTTNFLYQHAQAYRYGIDLYEFDKLLKDGKPFKFYVELNNGSVQPLPNVNSVSLQDGRNTKGADGLGRISSGKFFFVENKSSDNPGAEYSKEMDNFEANCINSGVIPVWVYSESSMAGSYREAQSLTKWLSKRSKKTRELVMVGENIFRKDVLVNQAKKELESKKKSLENELAELKSKKDNNKVNLLNAIDKRKSIDHLRDNSHNNARKRNLDNSITGLENKIKEIENKIPKVDENILKVIEEGTTKIKELTSLEPTKSYFIERTEFSKFLKDEGIKVVYQKEESYKNKEEYRSLIDSASEKVKKLISGINYITSPRTFGAPIIRHN